MFTCGPGFFGGSNASDPFYSSVGLLLHCDGVNGGTSFPDSGPFGIVVTPSNVTTSTALSVFGTASATGSVAGSVLTIAQDATHITASGTTPWTWEERFYTTSLAAAQVLFDNNNVSSNSTGWQIYIGTDGRLNVYSGTQATGYGGVGTAVVINTWYALRVTWDGTKLYFFINGVLQNAGGTTGFNNTWGTAGTFIMNSRFINQRHVGNMDELRWTKNVCRSTANYTVDTAPFPNN